MGRSADNLAAKICDFPSRGGAGRRGGREEFRVSGRRSEVLNTSRCDCHVLPREAGDSDYSEHGSPLASPEGLGIARRVIDRKDIPPRHSVQL